MIQLTFGPKVTAALLTALLPMALSSQPVSTCNVRDPNLQGTYEGDCVGGWASGQGRAIGKDQYEGSFRDGLSTGYGIRTRANGQRIEGEFVDGKLAGRGKIYNPNGDILEGLFEGGRLNGSGKLTRKTGESFDVEDRDGKLVRTTSASYANSPLASSAAAVPNVKWSPRLDLEDLFPAYILATATRKAPRSDRPSGGFKYLGDPDGLVGLAVQVTESNADVVVTIVVDEVAEPTTVRFRLEAPGDYLLYPKLQYKYDKLRLVRQPTPVNVSWKLTINGQLVGNQMRTVTLRSINDAPLHAGARNLSWVFAAYVTEDAPWIDKLLQDTLQRRYVRQFVGYQSGPQEAYRQVAAIYNQLQSRGVRYSDITTSSQTSESISSQVVRFPLDSINNSQANCIDGTVLMASVLRKIGLDAFIILGPGHAMLGYSNTGDPRQGLTVVETTLLGSARFDEAVRVGNARFQDWQANQSQNPQFRVIRISDARQQGVMPIPR